LAHNLHDVRESVRRVAANRLNGVDAEWLTPDQVKAFCPAVNVARDLRYPVLGATLQRRGGVARHDAVAWGYARAAAARGVDIIQNCPVTAIRRDASGRVSGVETPRGFIRAKKVAVSASGNTLVVMNSAGVGLPRDSYPVSMSIAAGARVVSRRRRARPMSSLTPLRAMSRIRSTRHSRWNASPRGD